MSNGITASPATLKKQNGSAKIGHSNGKTLSQNIDDIFGDIARSFTVKPLSAIGQMLRNNGKKVVITGDSISYNHQDLDATSRDSGDRCHSGMRSWSFMLQDIIHKQDDYFKYMDELSVERYGANSLELYNFAGAKQIVPFGGRSLIFSALASDTPSFAFKYKHQGTEPKAYFLMVGSPTDKTCTYSVSVDGVTTFASLTNKLSTTLYLGRDIRHLELPIPNDGQEHTVRFFNFAQNADVPDPTGRVYLEIIGMSSKYTRVDVNGVSGFNTADLLTQWSARVVSKTPDVLMILIGANDAFDGLPIDNFKTNLESMISQARAANAGCEVVLMSTPGTTAGQPNSVDDAISLQYVERMKTVAQEQRAHFVNLFSLFNSTLADNFRFDWVHLNRQGNAALVKVMADSLGLTYSNNDINPNFSLINLAKFNERSIAGTTLIASPSGTGTNPKTYGVAAKQGQKQVIKSAVSNDGETVRVTFNYPLAQLGSVSVKPFGFVAQLLTPIETASGADFVDFKILKADATIAQHSDYPILANEMSFLITYSGAAK